MGKVPCEVGNRRRRGVETAGPRAEFGMWLDDALNGMAVTFVCGRATPLCSIN
jgi:hypothetical protein